MMLSCWLLDLQHALGRFAAECEATGMRVSTSKSEAMVLDRKKVACTLQVGGEVLPQVEQFKYLGVLFTSEGRMDREIDRRIGAAAAVMWSMYRSVVVKKELSRKAKLSIYQSIYVPTLTYGHELWVMTERVRSRIQAAEMSFLRRVAGRSLRDRVRSSVTREELGVELLLLHIERGQLRCSRASVSDASGTSPWRGVPGMPHQEEAPGKTQDTLERLCLSAGLGTPRGPSGRAGGSVWGEGAPGLTGKRSQPRSTTVYNQHAGELIDDESEQEAGCMLSRAARTSMTSDFRHDSFRMPNIGFQNLPLNIYIVVFGTAIFVFILSLLFCCYLIRLRHQAHKELYAYKQVIQKEKVKELNLHEICAVCLEEFKQKDELGICPCKHAFHRNMFYTSVSMFMSSKRKSNKKDVKVPHQVVGGEEGVSSLQYARLTACAAAGNPRDHDPDPATPAWGGEPGVASMSSSFPLCPPTSTLNGSTVPVDNNNNKRTTDTTDLEEYMSSVTSYISKCIDDVTISKSITTRSNQKPWMTAKVCALLKSRDSAFRAGDKDALRAARAKLSRAIREAKHTHSQRIHGHFQSSGDTRRMWQGTQSITNYRPASPACDSDASLPDVLNCFYARFEAQNDLMVRKTIPPPEDQVLCLTTADVRKTEGEGRHEANQAPAATITRPHAVCVSSKSLHV
ncbi:hypothetical protein QTP86_022937 [Hemibagrus guttatus]|nr:hypothetical protein QTP86_022937 [Hemibagrus guttatus]